MAGKGALVGEVVGAIKTVASFTAEPRFLARYAEQVAAQRRRGVGWRMWVGSALMAIGQAGGMVMFGVALYYGFWLLDRDPESLMESDGGCAVPSFDVGRLAISLVDQVPVPTPMGITAENLAEKYGITRQQCDEFALQSQKEVERDH